MASFNGARWIRGQVESILLQMGVDVSLVIRDDGSSDDTLEELRHFSSDHRVKLLRASAPSGSASQNFFSLIRATPSGHCDFVALADQDDFWYSDKLVRACEALKRTHAAGYSGAAIAVWPDGTKRTLAQASSPTPFDFLFEGAGQGCTFVMNGSFYERTRDFLLANEALTSTIHYHDWAIYALARSWNLPWIMDPTPAMEYRQHGGNDTGARLSLSGIRRRISLINNGWYRRQLSVIAALCAVAAPDKGPIAEWVALLAEPSTFQRRLKTACFCFHGRRRRALDSAILVLAALANRI
jgi:rhamnosyltransferase